MNFLELCQFAHRYIGAGNAPPGTAPLDVKNQNGEMFSLVKGVQDAYLDIINHQPSWTFMQAKGVVNIPSGTNTLTVAQIRQMIPDYESMIPLMGDGARYVLCGATGAVLGKGYTANQEPCIYVPYQQWRGWKDRPPIQSGKPRFFSIQPGDESLLFDTNTNAPFSLWFDYRRRAPKLVENGDIPIFGDSFHSVVAWRAVLLWGGTNEAAGKVVFATSEYNRILADMKSRYLPEMVFSVGEFYGADVKTS